MNGACLLQQNEAAVRPESQRQAVRATFRPFPESSHVRLLGLEQADDRAVWDYARGNGLTLVSLDADFAEMAVLLGSPPKVIWLRCGNQSTAVVESLLRSRAAAVAEFEQSDAACLEIYLLS